MSPVKNNAKKNKAVVPLSAVTRSMQRLALLVPPPPPAPLAPLCPMAPAPLAPKAPKEPPTQLPKKTPWLGPTLSPPSAALAEAGRSQPAGLSSPAGDVRAFRVAWTRRDGRRCRKIAPQHLEALPAALAERAPAPRSPLAAYLDACDAGLFQARRHHARTMSV